jgi:hypothetical protein
MGERSRKQRRASGNDATLISNNSVVRFQDLGAGGSILGQAGRESSIVIYLASPYHASAIIDGAAQAFAKGFLPYTKCVAV